MMYAPLRGLELVDRKFNPLLPSEERSIWVKAAGAAIVFWHRVESDDRISDSFRAIAKANALHIERMIN